MKLLPVCVCVCVCVCVRARSCVRVCVCLCVWVFLFFLFGWLVIGTSVFCKIGLFEWGFFHCVWQWICSCLHVGVFLSSHMMNCYFVFVKANSGPLSAHWFQVPIDGQNNKSQSNTQWSISITWSTVSNTGTTLTLWLLQVLLIRSSLSSRKKIWWIWNTFLKRNWRARFV